MWPFKPNTRKQLARIEISGAIAGGTRQRVLKALKVVKERKYPGLLLRIDSPGGTVGDSQEIYSALKELGETTKIVASFGNISASGGVYIGMGAHQIVANPGTITGSIGVIIRGNNIESLLDKVGVSFKVIKSGPYKDILAFDRPMSDEERQILQSLIDSSYHQFVQTVAQSRNLPPETVRSFADGRIFTGEQAKELGLIDRLGTEEDARRWLADLTKLDPEKVVVQTIEERKPPLARLLNSDGRAQGLIGPWMGSQVDRALSTLDFELATNGVPLWLYRP
ncbi:signal peptide peptidase SppA [Limnothrix sp. FACHB-1083]|uniref:signal peptide peptidase SppA n=1 Tax=unclassified Limnothrix TaxID=2632864 RepID=UPI00167FF84E|nr:MULTISPECIES: signal peptide peptidase SppA [unclassified Limnothrix]MBD2159967.1 signal peptide peptidase SppA [Limnothrix sp. FACHB-1083]MBD2190667.1 signal peptide peptidase SppA [Limnothrix sp. FACHB-1088]